MNMNMSLLNLNLNLTELLSLLVDHAGDWLIGRFEAKPFVDQVAIVGIWLLLAGSIGLFDLAWVLLGRAVTRSFNAKPGVDQVAILVVVAILRVAFSDRRQRPACRRIMWKAIVSRVVFLTIEAWSWGMLPESLIMEVANKSAAWLVGSA